MTVLGITLELLAAADEPEADLLAYDLRAAVTHRRRQLALPQLSRLEHVIVDRDDPRKLCLGRRDRRHRIPPGNRRVHPTIHRCSAVPGGEAVPRARLSARPAGGRSDPGDPRDARPRMTDTRETNTGGTDGSQRTLLRGTRLDRANLAVAHTGAVGCPQPVRRLARPRCRGPHDYGGRDVTAHRVDQNS